MANSFALVKPSTAYTIAIAWVTIILCLGFGMVAIASAEELDELENTTVSTTNDTEYIELDIEFAETFENTSSETVEMTVYEETAYEENGTDAEVVLNDSVTGSPGEAINNQYNLSDTALEGETDYRIILETGNTNNIASGYVAADDADIGGAMFGAEADAQPGFGVGVAIAAIGTAGVLARRIGGGA